MMQPCIGENHPRAVHPVDQIETKPALSEKPSALFLRPKPERR